MVFVPILRPTQSTDRGVVHVLINAADNADGIRDTDCHRAMKLAQRFLAGFLRMVGFDVFP